MFLHAVPVRLVNGNTPNEGRVEINYRGRWGTICDSSWSIREANVICRQLGFPSASQAWRNAHFGRGAGQILLADVACDGLEASIDQCDHIGWYNNFYYCSHHHDVGVTCELFSLPGKLGSIMTYNWQRFHLPMVQPPPALAAALLCLSSAPFHFALKG